MKILYYFCCEKSMMFEWQILHIVNEMKHHNCEIEIFNPLQYNSIDEANNKVLEAIKKGKYDVFMSCHNGTILYPDTVQEIKKIGLPTLNFRPDNLVIPYFDKYSANKYDLVWLTSKETEYLYHRWGCNTVFLPYAANPYVFIPTQKDEHIDRLVFVGNPHGSRIDTINYLLKNKIPISVYTGRSNTSHKIISAPVSNYASILYKNNLRYPIGVKLTMGVIIEKCGNRKLDVDNPMIDIKEPVAVSDLSSVYSKYSLSLAFTDANSTGVLSRPVKIINLRNFEIPMAGGIQITSYCQEIADYFENNKEIILCKTKEELVDKTRFYLRPEQYNYRKQMRENARKRAETEHTWNNRFQKVFEILGIKNQQ